MKELMPYNGPREPMRQAVFLVASAVPGEADRTELRAKALQQEFGEAKGQAAQIIDRLLHVSPRGFGIERQKRWWRLVLRWLTPRNAGEAYLKSFPDVVSQREQDLIELELAEKLSLNPSMVKWLMKSRKFSVKILPGCSCPVRQRSL